MAPAAATRPRPLPPSSTAPRRRLRPPALPATTGGGPRSAPSSSPRRSSWTGGSTKRSITRASPSAAFSRSGRGTGAGDRAQRRLGMYDEPEHVHACRCWDSAPPDKWIANELRRDTNQLRQNDQIGVCSTPSTIGAAASSSTPTRSARGPTTPSSTKAARTPTGIRSGTSKTGRFEGGWTVEMAIPFKSLRYRSGPDQVWGIQLRRVGAAEERVGLPHAGAADRWPGPQAFNRISAGGTLVGLDLPPAGKNLELKPYAISRMTTDRLRNPPSRNDLGRRHRRRREIRRHRQPHGRLHRQHRLRAGRDRRAAGEPHALQPVLSRRSASSSSRDAASSTSRAAVPAPGQATPRTDSHTVLQPSHRPQRRPHRPDRRRRSTDRQGRQVRHRRDEHPDR